MRNRTKERSGPRPVSDVLTEIMAMQGLAGVQGAEAMAEAWRRAVGEAIAQFSAVGSLRRGVLEVRVANSILVQELTFRKKELVSAMREALPDHRLRDLRFRVGM